MNNIINIKSGAENNIKMNAYELPTFLAQQMPELSRQEVRIQFMHFLNNLDNIPLPLNPSAITRDFSGLLSTVSIYRIIDSSFSINFRLFPI